MKPKERTLIVTAKCMICGRAEAIYVNNEDWDTYNSPNRPLIQDIFPYLTPEERDLIKLHICGKCYENMFSGDEE